MEEISEKELTYMIVGELYLQHRMAQEEIAKLKDQVKELESKEGREP